MAMSSIHIPIVFACAIDCLVVDPLGILQQNPGSEIWKVPRFSSPLASVGALGPGHHLASGKFVPGSRIPTTSSRGPSFRHQYRSQYVPSVFGFTVRVWMESPLASSSWWCRMQSAYITTPVHRIF